MGKLTFEYTEDVRSSREANKIIFDSVPEDLTIDEFKRLCVRMAHALGYGENGIHRTFGDPIYGNQSEEELRTILSDIKRTSK